MHATPAGAGGPKSCRSRRSRAPCRRILAVGPQQHHLAEVRRIGAYLPTHGSTCLTGSNKVNHEINARATTTRPMRLFRRMNPLSLRLTTMAASHPRHCRAVAVTAVVAVAVAAAPAALVVAGAANKSAISVGARLPTAGSRHAKRRRPTAAAAAAVPAAPPLPPSPPPLLPIATTGRS